jgi:hypothetical protein
VELSLSCGFQERGTGDAAHPTTPRRRNPPPPHADTRW